MAETKAPAWNMKGTLIIACNCEYGCPCNVNGRPTLGNCEGGWTWQIEQWIYGDLKLGGLSLGLYADWPAAIHEGDGIATTLIDERADTAQRDALRALVGSKRFVFNAAKVRYDHSGRYAAFGFFQYFGP